MNGVVIGFEGENWEGSEEDEEDGIFSKDKKLVENGFVWGGLRVF